MTLRGVPNFVTLSRRLALKRDSVPERGLNSSVRCSASRSARSAAGTLVSTAPAGYRKTALLANWTDLRHQNGCFIACHFFRYVVVSFRAEQNETPDALRPRLEGTAQRLHPQYLTREVVQGHLACAGDG